MFLLAKFLGFVWKKLACETNLNGAAFAPGWIGELSDAAFVLLEPELVPVAQAVLQHLDRNLHQALMHYGPGLPDGIFSNQKTKFGEIVWDLQ
jgi:hypothetical protein